MSEKIINIKGARVNNLKNIDLSLPLNNFIVITGVSGSGKSSLAFDTLYAEGQRRYVESLSAYARQFLGRMAKPECDYITGLPPAIAIEQKVVTRNPRSTVGTSTENLRLFEDAFRQSGAHVFPIDRQGSKETYYRRHSLDCLVVSGGDKGGCACGYKRAGVAHDEGPARDISQRGIFSRRTWRRIHRHPAAA